MSCRSASRSSSVFGRKPAARSAEELARDALLAAAGEEQDTDALVDGARVLVQEAAEALMERVPLATNLEQWLMTHQESVLLELDVARFDLLMVVSIGSFMVA